MKPVMDTPRSVDIDITGRCNLSCAYCYHFKSHGDVRVDLSLAEWLNFFEELGQCAVMNVTLAGGEPFLRPDLDKLIQGIVDNKMRFGVLTNGTLITDAMAGFIKSTGRCDFIQVSLDGADAATHDQFRGQGAFDKTLCGIHTLLNHHIPVTVRVTVHPGNVRRLEAIARFLLEDLGLSGFSTNAASALGRGRLARASIELSPKEQRIAMKTLTGLSRTFPGRITAQAGPLAQAMHWRAMIQARDAGKLIPGGGYLTGCGCVNHKIAVLADGTIVPCVMLSHMKLGRVNQHHLRAVWRHHPDMVAMRARPAIPLTTFPCCDGCDYLSLCTGNCPGTAYTLTGRVDHPSPDGCLNRFLSQGGTISDVMAIS